MSAKGCVATKWTVMAPGQLEHPSGLVEHRTVFAEVLIINALRRLLRECPRQWRRILFPLHIQWDYEACLIDSVEAVSNPLRCEGNFELRLRFLLWFYYSQRATRIKFIVAGAKKSLH